MADTKRLPEFPTDWHQEQYSVDLERELLGYQRRIAELPDDALQARADAESGLQAVRDELKRLGKGQSAAVKRPRAASDMETRATKPRSKKPARVAKK